MIYIIDSSSLIKSFRSYREDIFPTFWKHFNEYIDQKNITSVREVLREIREGGDRLAYWATESVDKKFFSEPTEEEISFVTEIFRNEHYQKLVKRKQMITNKRIADPFLIARAKIKKGCLITEDGFYLDGRLKKGGPSPASICADLKIECVNLDNFMEKENWKF